MSNLLLLFIDVDDGCGEVTDLSQGDCAPALSATATTTERITDQTSNNDCSDDQQSPSNSLCISGSYKSPDINTEKCANLVINKYSYMQNCMYRVRQ